jgi:hypothetical protein
MAVAGGIGAAVHVHSTFQFATPSESRGLNEDQHTGLRKAAERTFSKACAQRDAAQKV